MTHNSFRQRYEYLILGQGLAGSLMAWRLRHAGAKVLVVDGGKQNASRVAAGLISPVTGRRWVKTQHFELLLDVARTTYRLLETELGVTLWYEHPLLRLYRDESERALAGRRTRDPAYRDLLGPELEAGTAGYGLADDLGGRMILQTAHLATTSLLDHLQIWLKRKDAFCQQEIDYEEIAINDSGIHWQGLKFDFAIFCEGWRVIHNPWFSDLPWQPSAGEILTLACQKFLLPYPINRGIWLLPGENGMMRLGATYRWHPLSEEPSAEGVKSLIAAFQRMFHQPPRHRCIAVATGIRPNTLDHSPILGPHPQYSRLILCNGFGSKGSLYAPWCCLRLTEHLLHGQPLPRHIDIGRYFDGTPKGKMADRPLGTS